MVVVDFWMELLVVLCFLVFGSAPYGGEVVFKWPIEEPLLNLSQGTKAANMAGVSIIS